MPKMLDIYKKYAVNYDELVSAEDYENNLGDYLKNEIDWKNKKVYEAGIGTGRLTNYFIEEVSYCYGFDRELHMLEKCAENHIKYLGKLSLQESDNLKLKNNIPDIDIFIEGWSLGHTIIENSDNLVRISKSIIENIISIVKNNGQICIVESAGTNVENPVFKTPCLGDFYQILENDYNFKKTIISTDYKFSNYKEAARIMGFFFGDEMAEDIIEKKKNIITEYTGIWILQK
jgi:SAM-dependent methyltransferase